MPELISIDTLLYEAFAVLANVGGGDLETQSPEWNRAFIRFRSRFHARMEIDFTSISLVDKLQDLIDEYGFAGVYKTLNNINILTMEESDGSVSLVDKLQDLIDKYGFAGVYKTLNNINILTMEESDGSDGPSEGRVETPE